MNISDNTILSIMYKRERIRLLSEELSDLKKELERQEDEVKSMVERGYNNEGNYRVIIEEVPLQARPSWKEIALDLAFAMGKNISLFESEEKLKAKKNVKTKQVVTINHIYSSGGSNK